MVMKLKILFLFIGVLVIGGIFRFWKLGSVPPGLHLDEVSEDYNAYSLIKTGKDRYGMAMPIIFKSYGSYQLPIYTYLTTIPVLFFGPTAVAVKIVSALSGIAVVFFTFLIIKDFFIVKRNDELGLLAGLVVAISPWAIFFGRIGTEASAGLAIFIAGFYFLLKSAYRIGYFPLAGFLLGLATHAYYSERILSILLLGGFVLINRKIYLKSKKWFIIGLLIFGLTQLPHLAILGSGAFSKRLDQVTYFNRGVPIIREFASQYTEYFSPRSLFFEPDDQVSRSMPDLSVFYRWMIVPFFFGFAYLIKKYKDKFVQSLFLLMLIAPIPAALTTDPFYTLRVFELLWTFSIVISIEIWVLLSRVKQKTLRYTIFLAMLFISLLSFYVNYFVLYKFERSDTVRFSSPELIKITEISPDRKFVVDLSRDISIGVRTALYRRYDPTLFQKEIGEPFLDKYYSSVDYEKEYKIDNVEVRAINWKEDVYREQVLVGDPLAISQQQVDEHKLKLEFELKDLSGEVSLRGYSTNPQQKCLSSPRGSVYCDKLQ